MSYISHNLLQNEQVVFQSSRHWVIFVLPAVFTGLAIILLSLNSILIMLGYLCLFVGVVQWISAMSTYLTSEFAVTNKRVIMKTGVIRRLSYETLLQRVAGIQVYQSLFGRLLNYGTVMINGTGGEKETFYGIEAPLIFRRKVQEQIESVLTKRESEPSSV